LLRPVVPIGTTGLLHFLEAVDATDVSNMLAALIPNRRPVYLSGPLDFNGWVVVRARDGETGAVREVALSRALSLGCHTLRLCGDGKPLVAEGDDRTFVSVCLDPGRVVEPDPSAIRTPTDDRAAQTPRPVTHERKTPMRTHESNGHTPGGRPDPPGDLPDPLAEAEAVRAALADAASRAARLVAVLRNCRKEQRALSQVYSSLKSLHLGP
jgi:hypothetical protein